MSEEGRRPLLPPEMLRTFTPAESLGAMTRSLLPDLPYVVHAENHEHHVQFDVYEVVEDAVVDDAAVHAWAYASQIDSPVSPNPTTDRSKAEWFLRGSVKWDGCSNWEFNDSEVLIHFCDEDEAAQIGTLFRALYAWARELGQDRL